MSARHNSTRHNSTRRNVLLLMVAAALAGGATGSMGALAQIRAVAQGAAPSTERLGLKGYDPVAYFTLSKPTPGLAEYEYNYDGVRYRFASARHRDMFKADPDKYAPQFGGSCAMNMSNGVRRESDPSNWVISNGHLYVFAGATGVERFRQNPGAAAARAADNWKKLKDAPIQ